MIALIFLASVDLPEAMLPVITIIIVRMVCCSDGDIRDMIPIDAALYKIKNNLGDPIEIEFYRATGTKIGSIKRIMVLYGTPRRRDRPTKGANGLPVRSRVKYKTSSKIPLLCAQTGRPITPFIGLIRKVDGEFVNH